jgi:tRNA (cmo5U34)-methyltransferase
MSDRPELTDFDVAPPVPTDQYDNMICRFVPGYETIFQLSLAHLKMRLPENAHLLIVGAGSGKEIVTFAQAMPGWTFTGVDPSKQMLDVARQKIMENNLSDRVTLHQGVVGDLPNAKQYDAATCILVMHFLPEADKAELLSATAARLKPGATFINLEIFGGQDLINELNAIWIQHGLQMGVPAQTMERLVKVHSTRYPIPAARTVELLEQNGFEKARRFYSVLFYGGWISTVKAS